MPFPSAATWTVSMPSAFAIAANTLSFESNMMEKPPGIRNLTCDSPPPAVFFHHSQTIEAAGPRLRGFPLRGNIRTANI